MSVITGGCNLYHYHVNHGTTNDYILHLAFREKAYSPRIVEERQYAFNREPGENYMQLRERMKPIMREFAFKGTWPDMKVYRKRKNFNLY